MTLRLWGDHPWAVPGYLVLTFVCVVLAVIDARTGKLPDRITYRPSRSCWSCCRPPP